MTTPTNICPECGSAPENPAAGDERVLLSASARDPARWFWPSGRVAVQPGTGGGPYRWLAWPDNGVSTGFTADTPEEAAEKIGARLPKPMCVAETVHSGTGERSVREG